MVSATAVIGRKVAIRPKRQDDWAVVPNLWGGAVGPPGLMRSPALAEALRPLSRLVSDAHAQYEEEMLAHHFRLAEAKARRHDLTRRLRCGPRTTIRCCCRYVAKYRSLMPALALILHVIDGVDTGVGGPVSGVAAERAAAWCQYLEAHARRLYATVTDRVRVGAALLASRLARGRLASPFTAREVYRNDWTGLTEPRVVGEALECLRELGWIRPEAALARDGGRPTLRFHINPRVTSR
jgi:hypothetical protein